MRFSFNCCTLHFNCDAPIALSTICRSRVHSLLNAVWWGAKFGPVYMVSGCWGVYPDMLGLREQCIQLADYLRSWILLTKLLQSCHVLLRRLLWLCVWFFRVCPWRIVHLSNHMICRVGHRRRHRQRDLAFVFWQWSRRCRVARCFLEEDWKVQAAHATPAVVCDCWPCWRRNRQLALRGESQSTLRFHNRVLIGGNIRLLLSNWETQTRIYVTHQSLG